MKFSLWIYSIYVESSATTQIPRRCEHLRNIEQERYVAQNGKILISIAPIHDKLIFPHAVRFSSTINVVTRNTFPVRFLKWTDVTVYYIELVKGSLQVNFTITHTYMLIIPTAYIYRILIRTYSSNFFFVYIMQLKWVKLVALFNNKSYAPFICSDLILCALIY